MEHKTETMPNRLNALNGNWNSSGKILDTSEAVNGADSYEWVAGGNFLMHRFNRSIATVKTEAVELIGCDEGADYICPLYSFDSDGKVEVMQLAFENDHTFRITGDLVRAVITIEADETHMEAAWEKSEDGISWTPWMEIKSDKVQKEQHIIAIR
jgi:hypothetical protein